MVTHLARSLKKNKSRLSINEQTLFLEKLAQLLEQDYSILDALQILKWHRNWSHTIDQLINELKNGRKFDQILQELQFDQQIVSFIYFALQHGNLIAAIQRSVLFVKQQLQLFDKFKQAIRYPIVLLVSFLVVLFFIDLYVYPAFLQLYSTQSQPSLMLFISMRTVSIFFSILYMSMIVCVITGIVLTVMKHKITIQHKVAVINFIPLTAKLAKKYCSLTFAIHLSSLLKTDLSFKNCLTLIINHNHDTLLSYYCTQLLADLNQGVRLTQAIRNRNYFDDQLIFIFDNQTNHLIMKRDLETYSTLLLEQAQSFILKIIKVIQPTVLIIIGISVVLIYLSILLPMLQLIQTI
ncbi:MAG TPA: hypothetical protein GXZ58_04530 [Bacilli bacterium]|nr:hypothetical protein [Bacilli bacterium]